MDDYDFAQWRKPLLDRYWGNPWEGRQSGYASGNRRARGMPARGAKATPQSTVCKPTWSAAQPISGGNAPAAPPITMFWAVLRFSQTV